MHYQLRRGLGYGGLILWLLLGRGHAQDIPTNIGEYPAEQTINSGTPTAINCGSAVRHRTQRVAGSAGNANLSALTPQILAGTAAGQLCDLYCTSPTNTVTIAHGNGVSFWDAATLVCGADGHQFVPLVYTGTLWQQRGPIKDTAQDYTLAPPADVDIVLNPSGSGQARVGAAEIATKPLDMTVGNDTWDGSLNGCTLAAPCSIGDGTVRKRFWVNGGVGEEAWYSGATRLSSIFNVPTGLTDTYRAGGIDQFTADGTAQTMTFNKAPLYTDGIKQIFNPNGTNAGMNIGAQAGAPSALANGDLWYDSTANKFKCYENATTKDCIGTGAGSVSANPIRPYSEVPVTAGTTFGWVHDIGSGAGRRRTQGLGISASLAADAEWDLAFQMTATAPTACTLRLKGLAAGTGNAQVEPIWANVVDGNNSSTVTHTSEGVTQITFATANVTEVTDIALDHTAITAGGELSMILRFESTSWTLNGISTWNAFVMCTY